MAKSKEEEKEEDKDLLLLAGLPALGSAGVVADLLAEADCHGDVTVIHRHHCHLFPGWTVRDAKTADVRLERKENRVILAESIFEFTYKLVRKPRQNYRSIMAKN